MAESVLHEQLVRQGLGSGSEGRPVELLSNFFKITTNGKVVYHYSIGLQKMAYRPEDPKSGDINQYVLAPLQPGLEVFIRKCSAEILGAYFQQNAEVFGRTPFVHDGAQKLYSTRPLDLKAVPQVQTFTVGGREARFAVTISLVGEIDLRELDNYYAAGGKAKTLSPAIIPVYEQVFRFLIEQQFTAYQSSFYDPLQRERSKSSRAFEFVRGFSISVRMTEFGLALNIHSNRSSAMVSQHMTTVDRFVKTYLGLDRLDATLSEVQLKQASKLLRGLKVKTTHTGEEQFFIIDCLSSETPTTHTFKLPSDDDQSSGSGGGKSISVREHFQSRYNMTLLPNLNLVKTTAGKKGGDGGYKIHLPMEKCHFVEHQFINDLKLPTMLQTELIELSSSPPNIYFAQVAKFAELISQIDPPLLGHFGLQLTTLPAKVPARVLDLPPVLDNQGTFYRVAEPPEQWAVVCFDLSLTSHQLTGFIESMREVAKGRGMKLCKPFPITTVEIKDCYSIFNCFDNMRILTRVSFVVFILPSFCPEMPNGEVYKAVKYFSDTEVDFISQCVRAEKAKAPPKGYFENVLDKINAKIGGINTAVSEDYLKGLLLPFEVKETMLVGIDVNHPGQFDKIAASIAAAVGTSDSTMTAYSCSVRVQEKFHSEAVEHIGEMVASLVANFKERNRGVLPRNILVFRDGVSDGYFGRIEAEEIAALETAVRALVKDVRFAFIIVQKNHNARFGLTRANTTASGKPTFNVEPGTVVDSFVVDPVRENMYLNSHFSYLGTSKPSRYLVLRDDFSLSADQLEKISFFACHNCARTRKPISTPVPIRYAHLCALRAMLHLQAQDFIDSDFITVSSSGGGDGRGFSNYERKGVKVEKLAMCIEHSKVNCKRLYYV